MGYQVLARKWRPQNFRQLVGQEHVVSAISNALDNNRLHHAYLFTGTRGVGKTTIARIFSKSLNCEQGMSSSPCGQCPTCQEIDQGNFIDLLEIDAASRTKVEDTRELLDNVQYKPTRGQYKVYLIDEVHMLSKHSFNALLKTLEEPPPHVKFLLATTDPQKLPVTILSRCLQFNLKAMSREQISGQLEHILQQEQLSFEPEALQQLARAANGSMRDALSLSDQAIAQGNGNVSLQVVSDMLGLMDKNQVLKLLKAILQGERQHVIQQVDDFALQAVDFSQLLAELLSLLHQIALTQLVPDVCKLETIAARAIYQLASQTPPEQIQLMYQIVLQGRKDLPFAMDGRSGVEMTLLRMLAFNPQRKLTDTQFIADHQPQPVVEPTQVEPMAEQLQSQQQEILQQAEQMAGEPSSVTPSDEELYTDAPVTKPSAGDDTQMVPDAAQPYQSAPMAEQWEHQQQDVAQQTEHMSGEPTLEFPLTIDGESSPYHLHSQPSVVDDGVDPVQIPEGSEQTQLSADIPPKENHPDEPADQQQLSQTQNLLALRRGLRQAGEDEPGKKPESANTVADFVVPRPETLPTRSIEPTPVNQPQDVRQSASEIEQPPWNEPVESPQVSDSAKSAEEQSEPDAALNGPLLDVEVTLDVPVFADSGEKITRARQLDHWSDIIEQSGVGGLTKQLALQATMQQDGDVVALVLPEQLAHLNNPAAIEQLQQGLSELWQQPVSVEVTLGQVKNTPFAIQQKIQQVRQQFAQQQIADDPHVQYFQQQFGADVVQDSIEPR